MKFSLVFLMLLGVGLPTCTAYQQTPEQDRLEAFLFENYDKQQLPSLDQSTQVALGMSLRKLKRLDFANGAIVVNVKMDMTWRDSRLAWDPTEFVNITTYYLHLSDIWTPDMALYNSNLPRENLQDDWADVDFRGNVHSTTRMKLAVNCTLDQRDDTHNCSLKWGSWSYGSENVSPNPASDVIDLSKYKENPVWEIVSTEAIKQSITYACCPEVFHDVIFSLVVRRRPDAGTQGSSTTTTST